MRKTLFLLLTVVALAACGGSNRHSEAEALLQKATEATEQGNYRRALLLIDSLRHAYPDAVDARKQALRLHQEASLKEAQADLATTDSALQAVKQEYERQQRTVDAHKQAGNATAEELTKLTRTRMLRDSLQVRFDVGCAKIKYIHKRQKELTDE